MPGEHNVQNALAALAIAIDLDIPFACIAQALSSFKGVERRFSWRGTYKGADIFDDYGHHPQEIFHTLLVAKRRTKGKLIMIFQPHRYSRTDKLWQEFVTVLATGPLDHLIITDIYAASEAPVPGITSHNLAKAIQEQNPSCTIDYVPLDKNFEGIIQSLHKYVQPDDLILLQGAGKINRLVPLLNLHQVVESSPSLPPTHY
jgi:UDP-N-acetylmuramate--alanine ligase